jgi:hypothetical protein
MNHPLHQLHPHHRPPSSRMRHQHRARLRAPSRTTFAITRKTPGIEHMRELKCSRSWPLKNMRLNNRSWLRFYDTPTQPHHRTQMSHRSRYSSVSIHVDVRCHGTRSLLRSSDNASARRASSTILSVSYTFSSLNIRTQAKKYVNVKTLQPKW